MTEFRRVLFRSGCEASSEITWFGQAFIDQALREQATSRKYSLEAAFQRARETVAAREKAAGFEPSNPQMVVGDSLRDKLRSLEARLAERPLLHPAHAAPQVQARFAVP